MNVLVYSATVDGMRFVRDGRQEPVLWSELTENERCLAVNLLAAAYMSLSKELNHHEL